MVAMVLLLAPLLAPGRVRGQDTSAYEDAAAERLHRAAQQAWDRIDDSLVRYTALVKERVGASLRTPLKDRTVYRSEAAHRVFWDRDGEPLVQVLAFREQNPGGIEEDELNLDMFDHVFDPTGDHLFFGGGDEDRDYGERGNDDFWFEHPLAADAGASYRFRSGDTLTLSLPDGRSLRVAELQVIPRAADVHRISGSLWIEPASGALVRAVYRLSETFDAVRDIPDLREEEARGEFRLVPGFLKPWTFELNMIVVEYGLWDFELWLPRAMRMEGVLGAGVIKAPLAMEIAYQMESVVTEDDLAEESAQAVEERTFADREEAMAFMAELAGGEGVAYRPAGEADGGGRYLVPEDPSWLRRSPHLPPPLGDDAAGFLTEDEAAELMDVLADLPLPEPAGVAWAANWGLERPDLVRYNRVEGLAVGARLQARTGSPVGPLSFRLEPFVGLGDLGHADDLRVTGRFEASRETLRRRVALGAYHEVQPVSRRGRHLGLGNSIGALAFGRDDGEYFLASGADLVIAPPSAERESWRLRLYGERHRDLDVVTDLTLAHAFDDGWTFRSNIDAAPRDELGAELLLAPWWGTDPLRPQGGVELYAQGAGGDSGYGRAALTVRGAVPFHLFGRDLRVGAEAAGGRGWGDTPPQRFWYLGGPTTLRGYPAAALSGEAFARGRLELARTFPVTAVTVFTDAAWAGARPGDWDPDDALLSAGVGASVLDGLLRLDVARGLRAPRQTRWDFYLDASF